jgi:RND family efflux transporter MFP subunit
MTTETMNKKKKILVPILIIVGGFVVMFGLIASRKKPESTIPDFPGVLVEAITVTPESHNATIFGTGTVKAKHEVALAPQVAGKVDWISDECAAGGTFKKGDLLFRIEAVDYELAVEQANARVAQAEYQLSVEQAQADVAKREWQRMTENKSSTMDSPTSLVLREPQLKQAESNLASAEASLKQAELALERTKVRAPFNGRVRRESVDIGQMVSPGVPVGVLYSTDVAEIEVGLPVDELMWLNIPGSKAVVSIQVAGKKYSWKGEAVRWVGALDSVGRLARAIVEINDPYAEREDGGPELAVGSFVDVEFTGKEVVNAERLPRGAVRSGDVVWIAAPDNTLEIRNVGMALRTRDFVYVTDGLKHGDRIITSPISGAATGLKVRVAEGGARE